MAGLGSDYIQQQLLDQSVAMNDNLSAMRTILLDIEKNGKTGSGGNGNGNPPPGRNDRGRRDNDSSSFTKAFKDMFGEAGNIGKTMLGNNGSIQNTVGAFTTSAKVLQNSLGKLPGPIGMAASAFLSIVEVGGKVYEYLNEQLNMYNQLNSAGLTLADGMLTVRKGSGSAFMSINEFSAALTKNSDSLAAMEGQYGDGVEHFGKLLNSVQLVQDQMGLYGVSTQQLADLTAKNYKYQKMYSNQATLNSLNEQASTTKFVGQMTYLSKSVGKSVDELLARFSDLSTNIDSGAIISGLQNRAGQTEKQAIDVNKSWTAMYASLGEFGKTAQKINASKWGLGSLPDEFTDVVSQQYADFMEQVQRSGITDQRTINQLNAKFIKEHEDQIKKQADIDRSVGNTAAETFHRQMLQAANTLNDPKNNPNPAIENFTNRFNLWIGKTFTEPFNRFYADITESAANYLVNLADNSTGAWDFTAKLVRDGLKAIPDIFMSGTQYLVDTLNNIARSLFGEGWDKVDQAFSQFMNDFMNLPQKLWDSIMGWWNSSSEEKAEGATNAINSLFDGVINTFKSLADLDLSMDNVKKSFLNAFESLKNKLGSMWDSVKNWWNDDEQKPENNTPPTASTKPVTPTASQPKTAGVQKVTSQPEFTKPEKIQQAEQTAPQEIQTAQNNSNDGMNKLLQAILNNLEAQSQNNSQAAIILRQIAENTEPPRNV